MKNLFVLSLVLAGSLFAADVPVSWHPEQRLAVIGDTVAPGELESYGLPFFDLPEGYVFLVIRPDQPGYGTSGQILETSFKIGGKPSSSASEVRGLMAKAGVPLKGLKGVVLATSYGARRVQGGTTSLALALSQELRAPVLATTAIARAIAKIEVHLEPGNVEIHGPNLVFVATDLPAGPTRRTGWEIEAATGLDAEDPFLMGVKYLFEEAGHMPVGTDRGDLRAASGSPFGVIPIGGVATTSRRRGSRIGGALSPNFPTLHRHRAMAFFVDPLAVRRGAKSNPKILKELTARDTGASALVLPYTYPFWFKDGEASFPQELADRSGQVVYAPKSNASNQEKETQWLENLDHANWVAYLPQQPSRVYYDSEIEAFRAVLGEKFQGADLLRKAVRRSRLGCVGEFIRDFAFRLMYW